VAAITAILGCLLMAVVAPVSASASVSAKTRWSLRGAGWGHGVGMSQYGAYGYARHGYGYRDILGHYFQNTSIARRSPTLVRVLLERNRKTVSFTGATTAGDRNLQTNSVYKATRQGAQVVLRSPGGRRLAAYAGLMTVSGGDTFRLLGRALNGVPNGLYRGSLDVRTASASGLNAINTLPIESYVQGVVPVESPPIWPQQALQAQAVAARGYALSTNVNGNGFEQYPDTRSQAYGGFGAETAATNNAVAATRGEVVTYGGRVVVTYFFSTSGGYTENVENAFSGSGPEPWLEGVRDPYDAASPYHRWGPYSYSTRALDRKLGGYLKGRLRRLEVLSRGVSPRIVKARVRGTRGDVSVTGAQLRARLGLRDTWFYLRRVSTRTGGSVARISSGTRRLAAIGGTVDPAHGRFVTLQRKRRDGWTTVASVPVFRHGEEGDYKYHVARAGVYRVLAGWAAGPELHVAP
jgi:stage II sporulation protein D